MADEEPFMVTRANPKSQILSLQSELAKMFFGFKSRWKTLAAWRKNEGNTHASIITKHIRNAFRTIVINRDEPSSISIRYDCPKSANTYNNKQKYLELEYMGTKSSDFAKYYSELNKYLIIK